MESSELSDSDSWSDKSDYSCNKIDEDNEEGNSELGCNEEDEHVEEDIVDKDEEALLRIPMDVFIYEILSHYELDINGWPELTTEFSLMGYFGRDEGRKIYFIFRNLLLDHNWPSFGTFFHFKDSPIINLREVERIRFVNFPYIHEFDNMKVDWLNLRQLEITYCNEMYPKSWFGESVCKFPNLEVLKICDNLAELVKLKRDDIYYRDYKDGSKKISLYHRNVYGISKFNKDVDWSLSNFSKLKVLSISDHDGLLRVLFDQKNMEYVKNLEEIKILWTRGRITLKPFIRMRLTKLKIFFDGHFLLPSKRLVRGRDNSNKKELQVRLKWSVEDIFPLLKSLKFRNFELIRNLPTSVIHENCFPILQKLDLENFKFISSSIPCTIQHLRISNCIGTVNLSTELGLKSLIIENSILPKNLELLSKLLPRIDFSGLYEVSIRKAESMWNFSWYEAAKNLMKLEIEEYVFGEMELDSNIFPKLEELSIVNCGSEKRGKRIFGLFPVLKKLDFKMNENKSLFFESRVDRGDRPFIQFHQAVSGIPSSCVVEREFKHYIYSGCFANSMKIRRFKKKENGLLEFENVCISEVEVGDKVESFCVGGNKESTCFSRVFSVVRHQRTPREVININNGILKLTATHKIFVARKTPQSENEYEIQMIPAGNIKVGRDFLVDRMNKLIRVTVVEYEDGNFVSNVYTSSGNIVVNSLCCSVYTSQLDFKFFRAKKFSEIVFGEKLSRKIRKFLVKSFL